MTNSCRRHPLCIAHGQFGIELFFNLFKVHRTAFATAGSTCGFGLEASVDQPSYIADRCQKNSADNNFLDHGIKVISLVLKHLTANNDSRPLADGACRI